MIYVTKANGEKEQFSPDKVKSSLLRAHVEPFLIKKILDHIIHEVYDNISTQEIYSLIYSHLKKYNQLKHIHYNLKRAIMKLGPTGYPFEKFIAAVLREYGYKTETNVILQGNCVSHEIDVLAEKDGRKIIIEAKFHNRPGTKSDVKTTLYTHARYLDVRKNNSIDDHWLITNTKATYDAVLYGNCVGMKVVSWDRPHHFSLRYLIESSRLYPVTVLEHLSDRRIQELLKSGIVFVKQMKETYHSDK